MEVNAAVEDSTSVVEAATKATPAVLDLRTAVDPTVTPALVPTACSASR